MLHTATDAKRTVTEDVHLQRRSTKASMHRWMVQHQVRRHRVGVVAGSRVLQVRCGICDREGGVGLEATGQLRVQGRGRS